MGLWFKVSYLDINESNMPYKKTTNWNVQQNVNKQKISKYIIFVKHLKPCAWLIALMITNAWCHRILQMAQPTETGNIHLV